MNSMWRYVEWYAYMYVCMYVCMYAPSKLCSLSIICNDCFNGGENLLGPRAGKGQKTLFLYRGNTNHLQIR